MLKAFRLFGHVTRLVLSVRASAALSVSLLPWAGVSQDLTRRHPAGGPRTTWIQHINSDTRLYSYRRLQYDDRQPRGQAISNDAQMLIKWNTLWSLRDTMAYVANFPPSHAKVTHCRCPPRASHVRLPLGQYSSEYFTRLSTLENTPVWLPLTWRDIKRNYYVASEGNWLTTKPATGGGKAHMLAGSWQPHYNVAAACKSATCQLECDKNPFSYFTKKQN